MKSHQNVYADLLGITSPPSAHNEKSIECRNGQISLAVIYEAIPEVVIATFGLPRSIHLWLPDEWQPICHFMLHQTVSAIELDEETFKILRRVIIGNAASVDIDQDGTIELPEHLCESSGINQIAYWRRLGKVIELVASPNPPTSN